MFTKEVDGREVLDIGSVFKTIGGGFIGLILLSVIFGSFQTIGAGDKDDEKRHKKWKKEQEKKKNPKNNVTLK